MRAAFVAVAFICHASALRPHGAEVDLEPEGGDLAKSKEIPDIVVRIKEDHWSWAHIGTAVFMLTVASALFIWPQAFAYFKAQEEKDGAEAESSDDEAEDAGHQMVGVSSKTERWFSKVLKERQFGTGLMLRFESDDSETVWLRDSLPKNMQKGAFVMFCMAFGLLIHRACYFLLHFRCNQFGPNHMWQADFGFSLGVGLLMAGSAALALAELKPREEVPTVYVASYWGLMFAIWLAFIAAVAPPFKMSCSQLQDMAKKPGQCERMFNLAARKMDCTLQGHTACQIFMLFLIALPFALPQLYHQALALLWLVVYLLATTAYTSTFDSAHPEHTNDVSLQVVLLIMALSIGLSRKYYLEKSMRHQFVRELQQRDAMAPLYAMFKEMVPEYVVKRMLESTKPIHDPCPTVTVLFVLIDSFNEYTRTMGPGELLQFLNEYFRRMDDICRRNSVTKIETVAEEYVACVGVTDSDKAEVEDQGSHAVLLSKLMKASKEILALQDIEVEVNGEKVKDKVKFKMGMHTGPIVAGVIGAKLPRFRLFGDVINTSARMMQKGQPGTVQFGEETKKYVSDDEVVDNSTRKRNGIVEMKGKGEVQTWVLKTEDVSALNVPAAAVKRESVISQMLTGATPEVSDDAFDAIMDKQLAEDVAEFSPAEEANWFRWWHRKNCKSFAVRMNFLTFMLSVETLCEVLHMEHIRAWQFAEDAKDIIPVPGQLRFGAYLAFRLAAFGICLGWCFVAQARLDWLKSQPSGVQIALVTSKVIVCVLVWASFNMVILQNKGTEPDKMDSLAKINQELSLVFMVAFYVIMNGQVLTFRASLVFIPVAMFFMALSDKTPLFISSTGRAIFVCASIFASILAYESERSSRARFRSKEKVKKTQKRIEDVLNTLMPADVLKELRQCGENPSKLPSHVYKQATITQSDLCGFTQLSSGKKPEEVVGFMSQLFGRFDELASEYGIYKVETVGDAYIAGMAEHCLTSQNSAVRVIEFGLAMIKATNKWSQRLREQGTPEQRDKYKDANVRCRVGVHHGECVGGIVGTGMMRYHLFGEFMSVVDILEATSKEGVCQISTPCMKRIQEEGEARDSLKFHERDDELKTSKGEVHTMDEVGGKTYLVYPAITEDRVRDIEDGLSELTKKVKDLESRISKPEE